MTTLYRVTPTRNIALVRSLHDQLAVEDWVWEGPERGNVYWLVRNTATRTPVGFASIRPAAYDPDETAFLSHAMLLPAARGRGLQRRLIRVRVAWARRKGYRYCFSYTTVDNIASTKNLLREGFAPYWPPRAVVDALGDGFHYFRRDLAAPGEID